MRRGRHHAAGVLEAADHHQPAARLDRAEAGQRVPRLEVELAVVIGRTARDVSTANAMDVVFGYTAINDISERKFNSRMTPRTVREFDPFFDWLMGKWFDGSAPLGPEIVTKDEIADPHDLRLRLWVNDELMQDGHTSQMIFRVPETIAYISSVVTLEPGDIIAMGTPEGVGAARGLSLKTGDRVRCEVESHRLARNRGRMTMPMSPRAHRHHRRWLHGPHQRRDCHPLS